MAELRLSPPPELGRGAKYQDYRPWLLDNFHLDLCSYCLLQYSNSLWIDHYVPQSMDESRIDQPGNLLLSCLTCGRQKSDYHPAHHQRRCRPHDRTGFLIFDVRVDDLARMFEVREDGSLALRAALDEQSKERAKWNVTLLRLDLHDGSRMRLLRKLRAVEALREDVGSEPSASEVRILDVLERDLAERMPMFEAFGIPISSRLRERLVALANEHRRAVSGH